MKSHQPGLLSCAAILVLAVFGGCDSKPTSSSGPQKPPTEPEISWEDYGDHVRLYEIKRGPNNEKINHGKWVIKLKDDTKLAEGYFLDGKESGIWRAWYPNGRLRFEGEYEYGAKNREWVYYDENGNVDRREHWLHGKLRVDDAPSEAAASQPAAQPAIRTTQPARPASQPSDDLPTFGR